VYSQGAGEDVPSEPPVEVVLDVVLVLELPGQVWTLARHLVGDIGSIFILRVTGVRASGPETQAAARYS
jgi:hypothetical protein